MSGKRLSKEEKEAILKDIRAKRKSFQQISKDHRVSISTVSRMAAELGLSAPRKKTKPTDVPEHSYDRSKRISALDRMLGSIEQMVSNGGLSTRQIKDLAGAAQSVFSTRRQEDIEPEEEAKKDDVVWDEDFAVTGESKGIGYKPNSYIGREMAKLNEAMAQPGYPDGERQGHPGEDSEADSVHREVNDEA
jgi:hypothetical protein